MKKSILLFLLIIAQVMVSQTIYELEQIKDSLESKRHSLIRETTEIVKTIDSVENLILFARIRNESIKSIIRKDAIIYKELYDTNKKIGKVKRKDTVYVIEYKAYAKRFEVLYKNQLGYIKTSRIKLSNDLRKIMLKKKPSSNYSSSLINTTKRKKYASRRYIKGPRGGCYYINSNGNKTYVSRSLCN